MKRDATVERDRKRERAGAARRFSHLVQTHLLLPDVALSQDYPARPVVEVLKAAAKPIMVEIAPHSFAPCRKNGRAPDVCLCMWRQNDDGTFTPYPINQRLVRLDRRLAELLGFPEGYNTLRRLGEAGFIEIIKAAPHFTLLNLDSYFNHLRRCAEDPWFWEAGKPNLKLYKTVIRK